MVERALRAALLPAQDVESALGRQHGFGDLLIETQQIRWRLSRHQSEDPVWQGGSENRNPRPAGFSNWQRWKHEMQRYLSTGTSMLVALMAAHRATASKGRATPAACAWEDIAKTDAHLAYLFKNVEVREGRSNRHNSGEAGHDASHASELAQARQSHNEQQGCE
jgi:hypothetical protein